MVEKGIRRGLCHSILHVAKANNKYMKIYEKNCMLIGLDGLKMHLILQYFSSEIMVTVMVDTF